MDILELGAAQQLQRATQLPRLCQIQLYYRPLLGIQINMYMRCDHSRNTDAYSVSGKRPAPHGVIYL